jgi:hypothetical protein
VAPEAAKTRVERLLDEAYSSVTNADGFSCATGPQVQLRIKKLDARYERIFSEVERRLRRRPYQSMIVSDCRMFDRTRYLADTRSATNRLDGVERMLRRGDLN